MRAAVVSDIVYHEQAPAADLAHLIACYWKFEYQPSAVDAATAVLQHVIPPDGCVSLAFVRHPKLPGRAVVLVGPHVQIHNTEVAAGSVIVGARLLAGRAHCLLDIPANQLRDQHVDASPWLGNADPAAILQAMRPGFDQFHLLDAFFHHLSSRGIRAPMPVLTRAMRLIDESNGDLRVSKLAGKLGITPRHLQRLFHRFVGLTPKEFLRIRRFRISVLNLLLSNDDYQDVIAKTGYYDQAHLINDFARMAKTNPTMLLAYLTQIKHQIVKA